MDHNGEPGELVWHPDRLDIPLRWRKPRRIFVCSMSDLFHQAVPDEWRESVWNVMGDNRRHTFMVLTKRPNVMRDWLRRVRAPTVPNVWLGVTVCNQEEADRKIPILLETPAALRFVSVEPMLGPVNLRGWTYQLSGADTSLDWVICGAETGSGARPMNPDWARALRDQCIDAGVPLFFKGRGTGWDASGNTGAWPRRMRKSDPEYYLLDGREWRQFPEAPHA